MVDMNADIFIPVTLGSKRFHHKHLREIDGKPLLKYLIERLQSCKKIRKNSSLHNKFTN